MSEPKFKGKEALIIPVVPADEGNEVEFSLVLDGDVIEVRLDGKKLCTGDWSGNFLKLFEEAVRRWK